MALLLKKKFKGSSLYQGLIFFPWAVSGFIIGIMWRWMFNGTSGVINDLLMRIHLISQPVGWLASKNTAPLLLYHSQYMVRNSIFYYYDYGSLKRRVGRPV